MPFTLQKGEKNLGSNKAFEKLTYMAQEKGDFKYIAFCDQDDVWMPEKIATLVNEAEKSDLDLVCSDMEVIGEQGEMRCDKLNNKIWVQLGGEKYLVESVIRNYLKKENIFDTLMHFNFFSGCSMLVNTHAAFGALPFSEHEWYDYWVVLYVAGTSKKIKYFSKPLLKRRFHENNQTVKLRDDGINEKATRVNFLQDLKSILKNKMNVIDTWLLNRVIFQFIGEFYFLKEELGQKPVYKAD